MPIYEYRCPDCNCEKEIILYGYNDIPQQCECGGVMEKLISLPGPAIFIITNRGKLVDTLNDDMSSNGLLRKFGRHEKRYKKVIGNSLFNQEKVVIGKGF